MEIKGYTEGEFAGRLFLPRLADSHKGDYGRVLIAAGSFGMAGACAFSAKSALRTGSGLVMILTPEGNVPVLQILCPEAVCLSARDALGRLAGFDAVAAGSGMGKSSEAGDVLSEILAGYEGPLLLDADGLNMVSENRKVADAFRRRKENLRKTVVTPHMGEAARLLGKDSLKGMRKEEICRALFEKYGAVTVLKGHETFVAYENEIWINPTGNPGMATAGSGDALTGIIVSLMGQGHDPLTAARAGVYLHGLAGDLAAEEKGEYSLTVSDIIERLPDAVIQASRCK